LWNYIKKEELEKENPFFSSSSSITTALHFISVLLFSTTTLCVAELPVLENNHSEIYVLEFFLNGYFEMHASVKSAFRNARNTFMVHYGKHVTGKESKSKENDIHKKVSDSENSGWHEGHYHCRRKQRGFHGTDPVFEEPEAKCLDKIRLK